MKNITNKLGKQLLLILIFNFSIVLIVLLFLIPQFVTLKYESIVYDNLEEQLENLDSNIDNHVNLGGFYYLYIDQSNFHYSKDIVNIIPVNDISTFIKKLSSGEGKINYKSKLFYYYMTKEDSVTKIVITDGSYIRRVERSITNYTLLILLVTYLGMVLVSAVWSRKIVKKIELLKDKVDNLNNENYDHSLKLTNDDELRSLEHAIEDMRLSIVNEEKIRNQLYQNISHDFKTPLTVIKSYIEAVNDEVEDKDTAFKIILEQTDKLENKVHSLLYLNKLDYLKEQNFNYDENVDIDKIIDSCIKEFKHHNNKINIIKQVDAKSKFKGTYEIWETIINNLMANFYRYAKTTIKISVKNNKMIFYNDGPNIENDLKDVIFIPFRKGIKGEFGLGLSIVKKSLSMMGYDIEIENHKKKGVSFIIYKINK